MKKNLLLILLFTCGITFAQVGTDGAPDNPIQALTEVDLGGFNQDDYSQYKDAGSTVTEGFMQSNFRSGSADVVFYTTRAEWEANSCEITGPDPFDHPFGVFGCNEPVGSEFNNCLPGASLSPGYRLTAEGTNGNLNPAFVLVGQGNFGIPSDVIATNFFTAWMRMEFPNVSGDDEIYSVGWDMLEFFFTFLTYRIDVYTTGNVLIGSQTYQGVGASGIFIGMTSDEVITRVDFYRTPQNFNSVESVDNLTLGRSCGSEGGHCEPSDCLIVTCPDDVTVACIENFIADAEDAIAEFNCTASGGGGPETTVYDIPEANINFTSTCSAGNRYTTAPTLNLSWTDASAGSIVGATIEFSVGVQCGGSGAFPVSLNGSSQGTISSFNSCSCATVPEAFTVTLSPGDINVGGPNTFSLDPTSLIGLWDVFGPGLYAQVTVETGGGGGGGDCTEAFRYFDTQPHQTGASNCPGTTYEIVYHVGDNCGNVGCCTQIVTIDNAPPTITVTQGEVVSCYEDIITSLGDATVTTSCGEDYDLKILPPEVGDVHECPGTTYTYTYRVRDNCGREVTADRVFTIGSNDSPTIVSPPDITVPCGFNAELNPDYAEVTTGCTLGYTTVVTGPVISGVENCPGSTYTYTYTVTDDCGRSASDTRTFTIVNGPPVFLNCPSVPLQLNCEDEGWELVIQAWLASIEAESDCSAPLTVTNNYNPNTQGLCISNGTKTVRWFATDNCGRTSMCEGMVIIADTEPPLFVEAPQDELVVCNFITQDKLDAWVDANGYAEVFDCWDDNTITWTTSPNNPTINCAGNPDPTSITVEFIARDGCGNKSSMEATFTALPAIPSVGGSNEGAEGVEQLQLFQNQPNPFSDETSISFFLPEGGKATLSIFDVSGKLLQEIRGDYRQGMNVEEINSSDLQPGMLYYQLRTATESDTKRMILLD